MSVELRPLGVECNLACQYCYQNPQRDLASRPPPYDMDAMLATLEAEGQPFALFGGEPLLVPLPDLERIWAYGLERFGQNRIQSNGALIEAAHVEAFLRYRVRVGLSIDGPGELNDARWAGTLERTRARTEASLTALRQLCEAEVPTSLILTLHRQNASPERLPRLLTWVRELDAMGLLGARLHLLEVDDAAVGARYALDTAENLAALEAFAALENELRMGLDVFGDMRTMLLGEDERASCVWRSCDPYTTAAVRSVEGRGELSNCGRTNKEGVDFGKADAPAYLRSLLLYQTPQAHGGCQGCRFFTACRGHCPGTGIDGDWRNRSEHCEVYFALFERLEAELIAKGEEPLSRSPLRPAIEARLTRAWARGENPSLAQLRRRLAREESSP
ncbi:heme d1 biosynthesis protein NirJ [Plesiocystis pacifica SIR-1]|uniref:Heme d1 biosynthesis protein NirJ n=1 Tax=Plesiocystis pacifica SIR-1 TaxID=391625 RepID=A6FYU3_9BACT|nr:radical SAM protein [Plesiocystis pacifica]EDM81098.1 heme d1 biosynthesis protein NirJ [Plesiocystis pacifica SIR-1]